MQSLSTMDQMDGELTHVGFIHAASLVRCASCLSVPPHLAHTIPYSAFTVWASPCNPSLLSSTCSITYWFPCLRTLVIQLLTDRRWLHLHKCSTHRIHREPVQKPPAWITRGCKAHIFHSFDFECLAAALNHLSTFPRRPLECGYTPYVYQTRYKCLDK